MICELCELGELSFCCWPFDFIFEKKYYMGYAHMEVHKVHQLHTTVFGWKKKTKGGLSEVYANYIDVLCELLCTSVKYIAIRKRILPVGCELCELALFEVHAGTRHPVQAPR